MGHRYLNHRTKEQLAHSEILQRGRITSGALARAHEARRNLHVLRKNPKLWKSRREAVSDRRSREQTELCPDLNAGAQLLAVGVEQARQKYELAAQFYHVPE